ncbi:MAG: napF, partial [Bacteroidetes bacterium]|nr:napF [Bacteroidota bacterium]
MYKLLKRSRVVISLLILVVITLNFLYFANRETLFFANFLKIQFVPALLGAFTGSGIIFSLLIILTLCFGRVYCSTLCPLGTLQDVFTKVAGLFKSKKNRRFKYSSPKSILRYSLLALAAIPLIFGITSIISYLDPYSNFGRISTELIGRGEQLIQNGLSVIVPESVFFRTYSTFVAGSFVFAAAFLILIIVMSAFWGRLYCNTICPVGTFLGLLSRFSMF